MSWRAVVLLAAVAFAAILGAGGGTMAGAAPSHPKVHLNTRVVAPGQRLAVIGTGWPVGTRLTAALCGADAVSPSEDCAQVTTLDMTVDKGGIWRWMTAVLPPEPCPCVVLVSGITTSYSATLPVTVVGAATAPEPRTAAPQPDLRVAIVKVAGGTTLASSFGASAPRTLELRVQNLAAFPVTPVLLGRWGSGTQVTNVISVPAVRKLHAGQSVEVRAPFALPALSMGRYTVRVKAEVDGLPYAVSASASTSTWPIALFVLLLVLLVVIILAFAMVARKRRRPADGEGPVALHQEIGDGEGKQSSFEESLVALGAQIRHSERGNDDLPDGLFEPDDLTSQLE